MSYRSKRTRALMSDIDASNEEKRPSSPVTLKQPKLEATSGRWGPFHPPSIAESKPTSDKNPLSVGDESVPQNIKSSKFSRTSLPSTGMVPPPKPEVTHNTMSANSLDSGKTPQPQPTVTKSTPIWKNQPSQNTLDSQPKVTKPTALSKNQPSQNTLDTQPKVTKPTTLWKNQPNSSQLKPPGSQTLSVDKSLQDKKLPTQSSQQIGISFSRPNQKTSLPSSSDAQYVPKSKTSSTSIDMKAAMHVQSQHSDSSKPTQNVVHGTTPAQNTMKTSIDVGHESLDKDSGKQCEPKRPKLVKRRRRMVLPDWPEEIEFDDSEEVLTIDDSGNHQLVGGSIQPMDVWHAKDGVRFCVSFNEFCQPLRKGGSILVRFLGDVAKNERFCPIRETNWHHINQQYKADIIKLIHAHFIIPDGESYEKLALQRTGKSWRQYRYSLKKLFFRPQEKTKKEIYNTMPQGHPRDSWMKLVDYWYSTKGQELAELGKDARASQNHAHITGATSFANKRADFVDEHGREPSELEFFKETHQTKDGNYAKNTESADFVTDVEAQIDMDILNNGSSSKSRIEFENDAFNKLIYGNEPPKRPVGYGFGVKQSDIFGVRGILKKEGLSGCGSKSMEAVKMAMSAMNKKNEELQQQNQELKNTVKENTQLLKTLTTQFTQVLDAVKNGTASSDFLDLTKSILQMTTPKVLDPANMGNDDGEAKLDGIAFANR